MYDSCAVICYHKLSYAVTGELLWLTKLTASSAGARTTRCVSGSTVRSRHDFRHSRLRFATTCCVGSCFCAFGCTYSLAASDVLFPVCSHLSGVPRYTVSTALAIVYCDIGSELVAYKILSDFVDHYKHCRIIVAHSSSTRDRRITCSLQIWVSREISTSLLSCVFNLNKYWCRYIICVGLCLFLWAWFN